MGPSGNQAKKIFNFLSVFVILAMLLAACTSQPTPTSVTEAEQPAAEAPQAETAPEAQPAAETAAGACDLPAAFSDTASKPKVALVRKVGEGGFMERYLAGALSMADELGVELIETNARNDDAKMVTAIENAIQQKVDAIIVDHGQPDTVLPAIQAALDAGIKVLTFDTVVDLPNVPEIEQDDLLIGFMVANQVAKDYGGDANVYYVNVGGFAPLDKRDRTYQSIKWRHPGLVEVAKLGAVTDNTAADTQTRMEAALKEFPDGEVAIAYWDEFAKGVVRAIQGAGEADRVKVYSVDVTNEDIAMMTEPGSPWAATVATDSYNVGRLAVRSAVAMIGGESLPKYLQVEPQLITQQFLLDNKITNMDELVAAMPALGESALSWYCWMQDLYARTGKSMPAGVASGGGVGAVTKESICAALPAAETPAAFSDPASKPKVALVRKVGEGGFMERYLAGALSMADELGIELIETNARNDDAKMVTAIENAIQQKVDAIIVDHGQPDTVLPAIQAALDAGIKVLTFDTVVDLPNVPEIEQDDLLIGYKVANRVASDYGGEANVFYVNVGGFAPLDKRDRLYQDVKWRYPSMAEIAKLGAVTDNTAADTQTRMEAALKEFPDGEVAIAYWDEFAKGVVRAIQGAGEADRVKVYSVDVTNEDIAMMTEPGSPWAATVATDSYNVGRLAVRSAAAMIAGESLPKYLLVEPQLITQQFLLDNKITNMDELVAAMPALGESALAWFGWMCK